MKHQPSPRADGRDCHPAGLFRVMILGGMLLLSASLPAAELPPVETVDIPTPAYARDREVTAETRRLLEAGDTAGLEKLADELRKSRETLDGGTWILTSFYDSAVVVPDDKDREQAAMDFYERWARESPKNITAQICLADALTSYAWNARGSGWADSVTEQGQRLFEERLDRAWEVLRQASGLPEKCPGWFSAAQTVALGQGWNREEVMVMITEAIRREPTFGNYYTRMCYWLLPRWYGEPGDFEKWIADQADTFPPAQRDLQYARFVWMADRMQMDSEMVFGPGRLDWNRAKRGFEALVKEKPGNLMVQFEFTRLALLAHDRAAARALFESTGGKYFPPLWSGKVSRFQQARQFAFAESANPLRGQEEEEESSDAALSPEMRAWVLTIVQLLGGLLGGWLAGMLLLVLAMQRKRVWAGVFAFAACILVAVPLGTAATLIPGAMLWLYLRRDRTALPPEISPRSGWVILFWVIVLAALYLGLQFGAACLAVVPPILETGLSQEEEVTRDIFSGGTVFLIGINAAWIVFLAILAICRPQNRDGWRNRLGLHPCNFRGAVSWIVLAGLVVVGMNFAGDAIADERTRSALDLFALGVHSPGLFFLALVVVGPVVEELLFRGFAYSGWIDKLGFWGTALVTTALFTALHIQYGWVGLLSVFILGLVLAALRRKTGSIYPCLAVHIFNNFLSFLGFYFMQGGH